MARRARRPIFLHALFPFVCGVVIFAADDQQSVQGVAVSPVASDRQSTQGPSAVARSRQSVASVTARDGSNTTLASGTGFFIDTGRIVVPRALLQAARDVVVLCGGQERRVTAVLAEDRRAGVVLFAVDLPDGAPPSLKASASRGAGSGEMQMLAGDGPPRAIRVGAAREVPSLGTVRAIEGDVDVANGAAVVDADGALVGAAISLDLAPGQRISYVVPASRVTTMTAIGPLPLVEWALRSERVRDAGSEREKLRGAAAALRSQLDAAAQAFDAAATLDPSDADAWLALAECRRLQQRPDDAIAAWRRAVAAQPSNPRFHHELGIELSDAGKAEQAVVELAEVVRLRPGDAAAQFNLGAAYGALGRSDDEYRAYQSALAIAPRHLGSLKNLGLTCLQMQRFDEAITVFTRAERLSPADPEIETGLGVSYFRARNVEAAIVALRRALQLAPTFVKAHFSLGAIFAATGDRAGARAECHALQALDKVKGAQLCKLVDGQ
jgi:Flp pilus assembly protein TadD